MTNKSSKTYRWGFVAAGRMAAAMAADLRHATRCVAAGVVSRTPESAAAFARRFGGQVYSALDSMLADPAIDVIYVSSLNNLHYSQVKAALEAGKPVLCEKPFTLNAAQLDVLIKLARDRKLFLMEAMWVRYLPIEVKLRELLAERAIGDVLALHASFHSLAPNEASNRFYNPALGGGALLDLGIYPISFASSVLGAPASISSHAHLGATGIDEHFGAVFGYANGATAVVAAGIDARLPQEIAIIGSKGSVRIPLDRGGWRHNRLRLEAAGKTRQIKASYQGAGYGYQAREVMRCLDAGELESPVMPLDESLSIMRTLDTLRAQWGLRFPGEDEL
jgi:predicted dehydrogenase